MDNELIVKLTKDLKAAVATMTDQQARFLVRRYYQAQRGRIVANERIRRLDQQPHAVIDWFSENFQALERQVLAALDCYVTSRPVGRWALGHRGVGPVTAAAFLAFLDITRAPTCGHYWRVCGLHPGDRPAPGVKHTWHRLLKTACWKLWQSWLKLKNDPDCRFAQLMEERRAYEWRRNLSGELADQARQAVASRKWDDTTNALSWYSGQVDAAWAAEMVASGKPLPAELRTGPGHPMLPPGHIQSRAGRWAVKLFLSHWHHTEYRLHYGTEPPLPFPLAQLGHAHYVAPMPADSAGPLPEDSGPLPARRGGSTINQERAKKRKSTKCPKRAIPGESIKSSERPKDP